MSGRRKNKIDMTISEQIESVKERMCDGYCKMLEKYLSENKDPNVAWEKMNDEVCPKCPLGEL